MLLENKYYRLESKYAEGNSTVFRFVLLPDCDVYQGHFPGNPVCPGVCGIELVKECAMLLTGKKLRISSIAKCRFTAVASPCECPEQTLTLAVTPKNQGYEVEARISDAGKRYMEYKGDMQIV